ncbi:hypothetical protein DENSPDRAFT_885654 [Dentipellis sp. KUC8613]|nr:hypothetical protein DENSPDRAFT_885654 [Dentipellis sp. KUC8613]
MATLPSIAHFDRTVSRVTPLPAASATRPAPVQPSQEPEYAPDPHRPLTPLPTPPPPPAMDWFDLAVVITHRITVGEGCVPAPLLSLPPLCSVL